MLLQLQLDEPGGEAGAVDGGVDLLEDVGNGADVVLVTVGQHNAPDLVLIGFQIRDIGNYQVDAQHILIGKAESAVDDDDIVGIFHDGQVFTDLVQSAEGNDAYFAFFFFWHKISFSFCYFSRLYVVRSGIYRSFRRRCEI